MTPTIEHCFVKIFETVAKGDGGRRSVFRLGYNLGRLSELTGLGREACWSRWKAVVEAWDRPRLAALVQELRSEVESGSSPAS